MSVRLATNGIDEAHGFFGAGLGLQMDHREEVPGDAVEAAFLPIGEPAWSY